MKNEKFVVLYVCNHKFRHNYMLNPNFLQRFV